MSTVQQAIEVSAPVHTVFEQLSTFESYPRFMTGVEQVIQISSNETHWIMDLDGRRREFDAQITECSMDERVSWSTMDGPLLAETITLRPMGEMRTQVVAQLEADLAFLMPSDRYGQETLNRRLKADLLSLKRLIEHQGMAGDRLLSGTGTITQPSSGPGATTDTTLDPASPAAFAARADRNRSRMPGATYAPTRGVTPDLAARTTIAAVPLVAEPLVTAEPGIADIPNIVVIPHIVAAPDTAAGSDAVVRDVIGPHDPGDVLPPGTHIGGAGMGGQAMSRNDAWGDGMINEEERGSAHDL